MEARMKNPAYFLDGALDGIQAINKATYASGVSRETLELVHLRTSQINGCSTCVYGGLSAAKKSGVSDDKLWTVAAWRESPFFSDAERAALALAEAMTRLSDRSGDAVSDELWDEVADHFTESELSGLIMMISVTNLFNRLNATVQEPAGATW